LDDRRFQADWSAVLARAATAGVVRMVAVATTVDSADAVFALAQQHPQLAPTAGIHPNHVAESQPGDWDRIVALAQRPEVVAIGETGLDRHWDFTPFAQQEEFFARHLALSRQTGKPLIIHCRECKADILRMVQADFAVHGALNGILHSFSEDADTARALLAVGLHLSFAGMVTYKNAANLRAVAQIVPANRILIETDSPYLTPVPHRGQRNEPAYVAHTAMTLAEVRGVPLAEFAAQTTQNARRVFRLGAEEK
jgi:TatD DNase family protein